MKTTAVKSLALAVSLACVPLAAHANEDPQVQRLIQAQMQADAITHAEYARYFQQAYAAYPRIPRGTLEAIAWAQTRWTHLTDKNVDVGHLEGAPQSFGVMGLYEDAVAGNQIGEAARLLGVSAQQIKDDPRANILAGAALFDRQMGQSAGVAARSLTAAGAQPEDLVETLCVYFGVGRRLPKTIGSYVQDSFAYDVLLALDRGVNENGASVAERLVDFTRAFSARQLALLGAPMVRMDISKDTVEAAGASVNPTSEKLQLDAQAGQTDVFAAAAAVDYPSARWVAAHPKNYTKGRSDSIRKVVIHDLEGRYAWAIDYFARDNGRFVAAHYVLRSSDGQITQMVREKDTAHQAAGHNSYTIGLEHEGFVATGYKWYTKAMYGTSAALVRSICKRYPAVECKKAYNGPAHATYHALPDKYDIQGHQHYYRPKGDRSDPGKYWDWKYYYTLLNPAPKPTTTVLDGFETSAGRFATSPTYSGSTEGIAASSSAARQCTTKYAGSCALKVTLNDNAASSKAWAVRLLSGAGTPSANVAIAASQQIGFYVYADVAGMSVGVSLDDADGTERSVTIALPAKQWKYVAWNLSNANNWNAWAKGNGAISAGGARLDAIWLYRPNSAGKANVYIDQVLIKKP